MSAAHDVTDDTFADEVLSSSTPIMVDFWAEWCGPCRRVSPILDEIATEHSEKIKIVKLNVDDNPQTSAKYNITSIPAMNVFQNGEVVKTVIGAKPKPAIEADLAEFLEPMARRSAARVVRSKSRCDRGFAGIAW